MANLFSAQGQSKQMVICLGEEAGNTKPRRTATVALQGKEKRVIRQSKPLN
jgi:hypothetical protein